VLAAPRRRRPRARTGDADVTAPDYDDEGRARSWPFAPTGGAAQLTEESRDHHPLPPPEVRAWLDRYRRSRSPARSTGRDGDWK
jgi:hypothetical protein